MGHFIPTFWNQTGKRRRDRIESRLYISAEMNCSLTLLIAACVLGTFVQSFIILPQKTSKTVAEREVAETEAEVEKRSPWLTAYTQGTKCVGTTGRKYKPGQSYRLDCNQCYCGEDGPICTLMVCW